MSENDTCCAASTPAEIAESRRKCWHTDCTRTARLEWCGWRYCFRHFWRYESRDALRDGGIGRLIEKLRYTEIARHRKPVPTPAATDAVAVERAACAKLADAALSTADAKDGGVE